MNQIHFSRIRAYLISSLFLLSNNVLAQSVTVRVNDLQGAAGKEVKIPIELSGAANIGAMHLELVYDAAILAAKKVEKAQLLTGNTLLESNLDEPGRLVVGLVTLDGVNGDGAALSAHFVVKGQAGQKSPLSLEKVRAWEGEKRLDVLVKAESGEFTVSTPGIPWLMAAGAGLVVLLILILLMRRGKKKKAWGSESGKRSERR